MNFAVLTLLQSVVILGVAAAAAAVIRRADARVILCRYLFLSLLAITGLRAVAPEISNPWLSAPSKPWVPAPTPVPSRPAELIAVPAPPSQPVVAEHETASIPLTPRPTESLTTSLHPLRLFSFVWILGAVALLGRIGLGLIWLKRLERSSTSLALSRVSQQIDRIRASYGVKNVSVLECREIQSPLVAGAWRPVVFLPPCQHDEFSPEEVESMVGHEMAHVQARDCAWALLSQALVAVFWVNPLAWLVRRQMGLAAEELCDATVLRNGTAPGRYAECLLQMAQRRSGWSIAGGASLGMFSTRKQLSNRIQLILSKESSRRKELQRKNHIQIASAAGTIALGSCLLVPRPVLSSPHVQPQTGDTPLSSISPGEFAPTKHELEVAQTSALPYIRGDFTLTYHLVSQDVRTDAKRREDFETNRTGVLKAFDEAIKQGKALQKDRDRYLKDAVFMPRIPKREHDVILSCHRGLVILREDGDNESTLVTRDYVFQTRKDSVYVGKDLSPVNFQWVTLPGAGFAHFPLSESTLEVKGASAKVADLPLFGVMGPRHKFDGNLVTDGVRFPMTAEFQGSGRARHLARFTDRGKPDYDFRKFVEFKGAQVASDFTHYFEGLNNDYTLVKADDHSLPDLEFVPEAVMANKHVIVDYNNQTVDFKGETNGDDLQTQIDRVLHQWKTMDIETKRIDAYLKTIPNGGPDIMPLYQDALKTAADQGKHVLAIATGTTCPPCRQLEQLLNSPEVKPIIERHFVVLYIDCGEATKLGKKSENVNGEELCKKLGIWTGFPSYAAVAGDGKVLAVPGSLGYPDNKDDDVRFFRILDAGNQPLSAEEKRTIQNHLNLTRPPAQRA